MKFEIKNKIYVVCNTGALGDTICTFPVLKILEQRGQIQKLIIDDKFRSLYELIFDKDLLLSASEKYEIDPNITVVYSLKMQPSSIHSHLIDTFSLNIADCILKEEQKNYPIIETFKLPRNPVNKYIRNNNYVVIAYGASNDNRKMLPEVFNGIKNYFFNKYHIDIVLLGNAHFYSTCGEVKLNPYFKDVNFDGCINLIDQTSIPEALRIISDAMCIIGVDNGLLHLAGLTDTKIFAGYTIIEPYYRIPYRHNIKGWNCFLIEPDSECKYCQSENYATHKTNFLNCNLKTNDCANSLTLDKWIDAISKNLFK